MRIQTLPRFERSVKRFIYGTPLGRILREPKYPFLFDPAYLLFFCDCIDQTSHIGGPVGEVGCFRGNTTVFLAKYLTAVGSRSTYFAFDQFDGFDDMPFDADKRSKDRTDLIANFSTTKRDFDRTMQLNGITNVVSRRVDVNHHDFDELKGCSFCLLDLDHYAPVKAALHRIYEHLPAGGIIAVDDCRPSAQLLDGAHRAYSEFVREKSLPLRIEFERIGVIVK